MAGAVTVVNSERRSTRSARRLLVAGLSAGILAVVAIPDAGAVTVAVATVEAENMPLVSGATVVNDAGASNGKAVTFSQNNTTLTATVTLSASSTFLGVVVQGSKCRNAVPNVSVTVDGAALLTTAVTYSAWHEYVIGKSLASGTHTLGITYSFGKANCTPPLYVDKTVFHGETVNPTRTVPLGTALNWSVIGDSEYKQTFLSYFSSMVPENEMKWETTEPQQNRFNFSTADEMVAFAQQNGKYVQGTPLVWHSQLPSWVTNPTTPWTRDTLLNAMNNHVRTEAAHFAGKVGDWVVVNEAFNDDGTYRQSVFYNVIGPDYVASAFNAARAADPSAKLCYNDYNIEWRNPKTTAILNAIKALKAKGVPIDCIGLEAHWSMAWNQPTSAVVQVMNDFVAAGFTVQITEADVSSSATQWSAQASIYKSLADACYQVVACTRFTAWGVADKYSWLGASATPLLFDSSFVLKPSYTTVNAALNPVP
jgi:GH35 family endo-1,4-beta-xylanase